MKLIRRLNASCNGNDIFVYYYEGIKLRPLCVLFSLGALPSFAKQMFPACVSWNL